MKDEKAIRHAREVVTSAMKQRGLHEHQLSILSSMSVALQWVCEEGGTTLQMLIDGEPLGLNKTEQEIEQALSDSNRHREQILRENP